MKSKTLRYLVTEMRVEIMQYRQSTVTSSSSLSLQSPPSIVTLSGGSSQNVSHGYYCSNDSFLLIVF